MPTTHNQLLFLETVGCQMNVLDSELVVAALRADGFELTDAGSILRQDRANYHKFGYRDRGDQGDRTFGSANARALIPAMLDRGDTDASVLRQIVRGTPSVCVWIFPDHIYVYEN